MNNPDKSEDICVSNLDFQVGWEGVVGGICDILGGVEFKKCLHVNINCWVLTRAADVRTNLSPERGCIMPEN